jgi:RNA polymerase sigma-70 factor (ECF subfamily)
MNADGLAASYPAAAMQRELVTRAKRGDHEAFTRLVDGSVDRLYTVANLILRDVDRAQDAVQEALVSAWRDLPALRDPEAWDAWLYRLTVRSCYRHARRHRRRTLLEYRSIRDAATDHIGDIAPPLIERDRLERELARLPLEQRAVIVTHFYLGYPISEVAEILRIPVGTAKSRLSRGLEALRDAITSEPGTPAPSAVSVRTP